jgi:membrane protease YdiL (CAAX protease family)
MGILGFLSLVSVYEGYFSSSSGSTTSASTTHSQPSIGTLIFGLAVTWAIIVTPVIAASQKLRSFAALYRTYFRWIDLLWGFGLLSFNFFVSFTWTEFCYLTGLVARKDKIGNVGEFVNSNTQAWSVVVILLGGVLAPVFEELFFRGLLFPVLRLRFSFFMAGALSAACFALVHVQGKGSQDVTTIPIIFILGFGLAFFREKTGRITPGMCGHIMINLVTYLIAIYFTK